MQKHELKRNNKNKVRKTIGRGGKRGKTSGKGHKGQKARSGTGMRPDIRDMIKRIPKLRGRGVNSNKSIHKPVAPVSLGSIEANYKDGEVVSPKTLFAKSIVRKISGKIPVVKILSSGDITVKVTIVDCGISASAKELVEKAGGKVILK